MTSNNDRRRYGVIEVCRLGAECYHLTIDGVMWAEVEWSASRRAWCIQDAAGMCLAHVEHIHDQHPDAEAAIRLARRMIVDGRMPTPEEAQRQLKERQGRERLGEPFTFEQPAKQEAVPLVTRGRQRSIDDDDPPEAAHDEVPIVHKRIA